MWSRNPSVFSLALFVFVGFLVSLAITQFLMRPLFGIGVFEFYEEFRSTPMAYHAQAHRFVSLVQQLFMFFIPGIWFYKRFGIEKDKHIGKTHAIDLLKLFALIFFTYPIIVLCVYLGQSLQLFSWMGSADGLTEIVVQQMVLQTEHWSTNYLNVLILCLLPAVGEELVFRYGLQYRILQQRMRPESAIFLTAFVFSFIHFESEGFLARLLLGMILGYLFYFSKNLLLPMLFHFINNYVAVLGIKSGGIYWETWFTNLLENGHWLAFLIFVLCAINVVFLLGGFRSRHKKTAKQEPGGFNNEV